ncbi:MAG: NADPH:quinone reductase [Gammaproteobacteria bacterium]|nr:NADPH:quinone reductase [Gammaproteobacteria bacterium]
MQAAWYSTLGPAREVLVIGEMARPEPAAGEVLVRVYASGVNPSDVKARAGTRAGVSGLVWPRVIPHSDGAGIVEDVGADVPRARVGERVWLWNAQWQRPFGTAAEYVALPAAQAVPLPASTSFTEGACLGIPAMTAHRCIHADGPVSGQTLLITGGAGTVARYAIQFAKLAGATVVTTVSNPTKAGHARSAGADFILNYREDDVASAVMDLTAGRGVDRIVDLEFGANLPVSLQVIRPNGLIVAYGSAAVMRPELPFYPLMFKGVNLRLVLIYILPDEARAAALRDLGRLLNEGALSHAVARCLPLAETAAAHELVESSDKLGSVVVLP